LVDKNRDGVESGLLKSVIYTIAGVERNFSSQANRKVKLFYLTSSRISLEFMSIRYQAAT